jgi:glycosyltransferase involved in cell wall biosynthesis
VDFFDAARPIPILILSDGPCLKTGLGRIGHDLAWLLSSMPEFLVGYLGRQAFGRIKFPWQQYSFSASEQWGESRIEEAWNDLAQGARGIIFTVWDATRLLWFADPVGVPEKLQRFLTSNQFQRWGYFMQDAAGLRPDLLPMTAAEVMAKYDRTLLASKWAHQLAARSITEEPDWIPHGLNLDTFKPVDRAYARSGWGVGDKEIILAAVMANQERKYWPVVLEALARLDARLWIHTDTLVPLPGKGYWNIGALAVEYGIGNRILYEDRELSDKELAMRYSASDATVVISGGEGFCYPVAESMACGTPAVTGSYGAQAEIAAIAIHPAAYRITTQHNVRWAVYRAEDLVEGIKAALQINRDQCRERVEHLDWRKVGIVWRKWFRKGICDSGHC